MHYWKNFPLILSALSFSVLLPCCKNSSFIICVHNFLYIIVTHRINTKAGNINRNSRSGISYLANKTFYAKWIWNNKVRTYREDILGAFRKEVLRGKVEDLSQGAVLMKKITKNKKKSSFKFCFLFVIIRCMTYWDFKGDKNIYNGRTDLIVSKQLEST